MTEPPGERRWAVDFLAWGQSTVGSLSLDAHHDCPRTCLDQSWVISFPYSVHKHLLSTCCVPGAMPNARTKPHSSFPLRAHRSVSELAGGDLPEAPELRQGCGLFRRR